MTRYLQKKRPPFVTLSKHARRDEVIRLKGKITRDAASFGGLFTSYLLLNEPGRPDAWNQSFSFYFLGQDRFTIWNAQIITAHQWAWDEAHDLATERTVSLMSPAERLDWESLGFLELAEITGAASALRSAMTKRKAMRFAAFDGRSFHEQREKLEAEIIRHELPTVYESFRLDHSYVYGIGLSIVIDAPVINQKTIEQAITAFRALGETDWQSATPVPSERLPVISQKEALARPSVAQSTLN